jgi:hypothetical protein
MLSTAVTLMVLATLTATPEDALVGRWGIVEGQPRVLLDLQPNGLARVFIVVGLWTANEHEIRLVTPDKPDESHAVSYSFEGKKLKVDLGNESPVTLERLEAPPEYSKPKSPGQPRLLTHGFVATGSDVYSTLEHDAGIMGIGSSSWIPIPGANGKEFEALAPGIGKDSKGVYCFRPRAQPEPRRLEAADPKTFRVLIPDGFRPYFADANDVFTDCSRLVKRDPAHPKKPGSFDSKTFALEPSYRWVKDHTGVYVSVPLPSSPDIKNLLDQMLLTQVSVYERVSNDANPVTEQNDDTLPKPSPLTWDDLPPKAH